jgi:hypothetical protein
VKIDRVGLVMVALILASCSHGGARSSGTSSTTASARPPVCATVEPPTVPTHQRDGTAHTLVPGQPVGLRVCRYHGYGQAQAVGTLARSAHLAPTLIARELDAIRAPRAEPSCFAGRFESYALWFTYRDGPPLLVEYSNGGCGGLTNGDFGREFPPDDFTRRLERAVGTDNA